jgi:hypothetical protein
MDSWSLGKWVEWCPQDSGKSCGYNFVLPDQKCLFQWYDRREINHCMKNKWLMLLGGSNTMNLGMTWLMMLDPMGTKDPFIGARWYNKTCWHYPPCEKKGWTIPWDSSMAQPQHLAYDLILDSNGNIVYKVSGNFDGRRGGKLRRYYIMLTYADVY